MNKTYKTAMDKVEMSEEKQTEIFEKVINSTCAPKKKGIKYKKLIYAVSVAAAFVITILAIPATRAAAISVVDSIKDFFTYEYQYADGMKVVGEETKIEDETGSSITKTEEISFPDDSAADYVEIDGDKVYFVFNNEHIDITDKVSESSFFRYDVKEENGDTMLMFIGGNVDNLGLYKLYFRSGSKDWASSYSGDNETEEWCKEINRNIEKYRIEVTK